MNKIMILKAGSPAIHKLGDIGREVDDCIRVHDETDTHYIGNFEEGYGFIDVKFKKEDCRPLTESERKDLNGKWYSINGNPLYRIYIDEEGNVVSGKILTICGIINKITDTEGFAKQHNWVGMNVTFPEKIEIGKSLYLTTDAGLITTSKVSNFEIDDSTYIIQTKNSIYYIDVKL